MKRNVGLLLAITMACMALAGCTAQAFSSEPEESLPLPDEASIVGAEVEPTPEESEEPVLAGKRPLTPVLGNQIADGTYTIEVTSSSSMFRIVDAKLTVADGKMTAVLTLSGTGYEKLYMGTGEEALADTDDNCIYFVEDAEGSYTYEVPVAALDQETDVAAWSFKKETWYDRVLVFQSGQLPQAAFVAEQALSPQLQNGQYAASVTLSGGSGRAGIESPAIVTITGGTATAIVTWSSPYYEHMLIDGVYYYPVNTEGNSVFEIPVSLDEDTAVSAQTIAMSQPHQIDYTLSFDWTTLVPLSD